MILIFVAAVVAGAIAALAGFGVGSVLTPVLAARIGTKLAVAAVAIPHFVATLIRFIRLRHQVDRAVLSRFGIASAAGGLAGALLHAALNSNHLEIIFGLLLILAGSAELTGWMKRSRLSARQAALAGVLSGVFGGLVGNQGGIRTAALLRFDLERAAFIATATAVALIVDAARLPVYLAGSGTELLSHARLLGVATAGVTLGTFAGEYVLRRLPERWFRTIVAVLLLTLGVYMLLKGIRS